MAALGAGKLTPGSQFTCAGGRFGPSPEWAPACWIAPLGGEHGSIDLRTALRVSCNIYFEHVGNVLGPRMLCDWLRLFGFGSCPGTGLSEERSGSVPTDEWMRQHTSEHRPLLIGDAWQMAIGQGPLTASTLQVANAMATIARGGRFLSPLLAAGTQNERIERDLGIPEQFVQVIHEGMHDVVHASDGTAHKYVQDQLASMGVQVCGKTGTAEVPPQRIDSNGDGRITEQDQIVRDGNLAWFAGFAPFGQPQVAFAVTVEYVEGSGGASAGPIAMEVVRACRDLGYIR
jgi:penicillin-binding protein 2